MGMNTGMLFGKVESVWGPARDVMVDISKLTGDSNSRINIQVSEDNPAGPIWVVTDKNGKYVLPFFWDGTQIAKAISGTMKIHCFAFKLDTDRLVVRGHLCLNLKALISAVYPTFDNPTQEALDVAKDFIMAYRGVAPFAPHHKMLLSTEVWGIVAKANFFVRVPH